MKRAPSERTMSRFFREACIQGRLDHPAIVPVHELGVDQDGRPFFTMKKLTGTTLCDKLLDDEPHLRLLRAFVDVCLAVEFAHSRGVIHRDLKPANIVLGDYGEVYVLDWGIAKLVDDDEHTGVGATIGTPGYMSPEQISNAADVDERADVYALGCMLFEILAGEPLHPRGDDGIASALAGCDARPSVRAPSYDIPPELDALCVAATAGERSARMRSPRQLGEGVQRYLDGDRDLALRQQLARAHLDAARTAYAAGDQRVAMRDSARSLALDPQLAGAAELVSRLMLEPPRVRPPEVQELIEADNLETIKRQANAAALGYLGFLAFVPGLFESTMNLGYLAALLVLLGFNIVTLVSPMSFKNRTSRTIRIGIGNALLVGLLGYLYSPFLIAPGVAAIVTMALGFAPTYRRLRAPVLIGCLFLAAVLAPWLAEELGWLPTTIAFVDGKLVLGPTPLPLSLCGLVIYAVALIASAAGLAYANRLAEREVRERLHLQAWQLRQLVS